MATNDDQVIGITTMQKALDSALALSSVNISNILFNYTAFGAIGFGKIGPGLRLGAQKTRSKISAAPDTMASSSNLNLGMSNGFVTRLSNTVNVSIADSVCEK